MTKKAKKKGRSTGRPAGAVLDRLPRDAEDEEQRAVVEATENLWRAMEHVGLSQSEQAAELGVGRSSVTRLLQGNEGITIQRLARVAHALGMSLHVSFRKPPAKGPVIVRPDERG